MEVTHYTVDLFNEIFTIDLWKEDFILHLSSKKCNVEPKKIKWLNKKKSGRVKGMHWGTKIQPQ